MLSLASDSSFVPLSFPILLLFFLTVKGNIKDIKGEALGISSGNLFLETVYLER